mmetsp:Transcript_339/g.624  ORF Transcript_339/g.624 Transcript_339/m.624 type:complete len:373 (-) Transcript_339:1983-3101(-)|eukprot:CAMPEP_0182451558 /NCGR_PEP_ID=MMETSP1172-20130603/43786_1 /TAXON_ID=708627 /ORGANISM="Timspurckia oligopyrenoides, Strain CCMP3278" /LENGTH=372 /DNA_ID=CAMNT_0024649341 /DNA_START=107 /DNA_END=1225 /DNA_ORIENTATION=-
MSTKLPQSSAGSKKFGRTGSSIAIGQKKTSKDQELAVNESVSDDLVATRSLRQNVSFRAYPEGGAGPSQRPVSSSAAAGGVKKERGVDATIANITGDNYFLGTGDSALQRKKSLLKSQKRQIVIKMPVIIASPYGKLWAVDILALYHNAVKKELQDMYHMVEAMHKFQMSLGMEDIERFYSWWEVFEGFVIDYFDIEENVVFPYLAQRVNLNSTKLNDAERKMTKGKLTRVLKNIDDMEDRFHNRPPGEMLKSFVAFLDEFSPRLLGYFQLEERIVPKLFQSNFEESDRGVIQARVYDFLKNRQYMNETLVLQSRWLPAIHLKVWKIETLKGTSKVAYNVWRAKLERTHCILVNEFKQRVVAIELEELEQEF